MSLKKKDASASPPPALPGQAPYPFGSTTQPTSVPPIEDVFHHLVGTRGRINALDEQISSIIRSTEELLREFISIRVGVLIRRLEPGSIELLTFTKLNGKWCLALEFGHEDEEEDDFKQVPLLSASREMRSRVFVDGHVERLMRASQPQIDEQITLREQAIGVGQRLLASLKQFGVRPESSGSVIGGPDDDLPF